MNVLIADDHAIVRHGIKIVLKDILPEARVFQEETFDSALKTLKTEAIGLLILDINIPGGNNIEMIELVKLKHPSVKLLMFSGYDEHIYSEKCIAAGADGYLSKNASPSEIKAAINVVLLNRKYLSEDVKIRSQSERGETNLRLLSKRELEVAMLLTQGVGVIEISKTLNLQTSTVSAYKNRVFEKLDISNIAELIEKFKLYKSL